MAGDRTALRQHSPLDDRLGIVTGGDDGSAGTAAHLGCLGEVRARVAWVQLVLVGHQVWVQALDGRIKCSRLGLRATQPVPVQVHVVGIVPQERLRSIRVRHRHDYDRGLLQITRQRRVLVGLHERVDERQGALGAGRLVSMLAAEVEDALSRLGRRVMQRDHPQVTALDGAAQAGQRHPARMGLVIILQRPKLLEHGGVARCTGRPR